MIGPAGTVFLVGFMGAGKSEVGRRLADRIGCRFVDTDERVEADDGRTVEKIFEQSGEDFFRAAEERVLDSLLGKRGLVVATGGGLFVGYRPRSRMKRAGRTVWLDAPLAVIERRVGGAGGRPMWPVDDPVSRRALFEKRRAVYALADVRVDASPDDPDTVAARVAAALG